MEFDSKGLPNVLEQSGAKPRRTAMWPATGWTSDSRGLPSCNAAGRRAHRLAHLSPAQPAVRAPQARPATVGRARPGRAALGTPLRHGMPRRSRSRRFLVGPPAGPAQSPVRIGTAAVWRIRRCARAIAELFSVRVGADTAKGSGSSRIDTATSRHGRAGAAAFVWHGDAVTDARRQHTGERHSYAADSPLASAPAGRADRRRGGPAAVGT